MKKTIFTRFIPAFAGVSVAALAVTHIASHLRSTDTHFVKTSSGLARIHTVFDKTDNPVRVLQLQGAYESATYLDEENRYTPVFAYQRAFDHVLEGALPSYNILMIGGGGYAWPKHVMAAFAKQQTSRSTTLLNASATHQNEPTAPQDATAILRTTTFTLQDMPALPHDLALDVVEVDPAITAIAKKWFFLDTLMSEFPSIRDHLNLITADGRTYLEEAENRYGVIINDTFSGKSPVLSLASVEAMQLAKQHLVPGGIYATNVVSEQEGFDISFLRKVVTTLHEVFAYVYIIPCEDADFGLEDNYLVLASDAPHSFTNTMPYDDEFLSSPLRDTQL